MFTLRERKRKSRSDVGVAESHGGGRQSSGGGMVRRFEKSFPCLYLIFFRLTSVVRIGSTAVNNSFATGTHTHEERCFSPDWGTKISPRLGENNRAAVQNECVTREEISVDSHP